MKTFMARTIAVMLTVLTLAAGNTWAQNVYYKWKDENNVVHYGEKPPEGVKAEKVDIYAGKSKPTEYQRPTQEKRESEFDRVQRQNRVSAEEREQYCQAARSNLETINSNPRIQIRDANGNSRVLTQEEVNIERLKAERAVRDFCN